ncbi:hypothetical protein HZS_6234, partial [Henneguya salminicola]
MNVEGNSLKEVNIIQNDVSFTEVVCLGNKGNIIMLADMEANIALIDTKKNTTQYLFACDQIIRIYQNKGQQIKSIKFGPSSGNPLVAIIFSESFQIWNSASLTILFDSNRITGSVVIDIDWVSTNLLIIAFGDGTVQIIDILKGQPNVAENNLYHIEKEAIIRQVNLCLNNFPQQLNKKNSLKKRALFVSSLLGEESDIHFWRVANYYIDFYSNKSLPLINAASNELDPGYGTLCGGSTLRRLYLWYAIHEKSICHKSNKLAFEYISRWLLYLHHYEEAIKLTLNCHIGLDTLYQNLMKALLIESFRQADPIDKTTYLHVATKLMSLKMIYEAVDLLILTNNHLQACTYLIENDHMDLAIILAKLFLNQKELDFYGRVDLAYLLKTSCDEAGILIQLKDFSGQNIN